MVVVAAFGTALLAMNLLSPSAPARQPALADSPPLKPATRTSVVVAPTAIALTAIRDALEAQAPRDLSGKRENPIGQLLQNAELGWTMSRGPLAIAGRPEGLTVMAPLNGTFRLTGQIGAQVGNQVGNITGAIGGLLNDQLGKQMGNLTGRALDQRADVRGNIVLAARPALNAELAARSQSHRPGGDRRCQSVGRGGEAQPLARGEAAARPRGRRTGECAADAPAQRSVHRAGRAARVGEDVPVDSARQGRRRHARLVARSAPGPRGRGAAEDRCRRGDAHDRRAGRDAHFAHREQAGLSVSGDGRDRSADGAGPRLGRRAGRPAVHRGQQADRSRSSRERRSPRTRAARSR